MPVVLLQDRTGDPTHKHKHSLPARVLLHAAVQVETTGITLELVHSTQTATETQALVVVVAVLPEAVVMADGLMANTLLDLPTNASSESFSVSQMTQPSNKPVSISRSTMISQSRLQGTMSQSQSSNSPTHLLMITSSRTSILHTTRSQPQSKSTLFQSSWAVVI